MAYTHHYTNVVKNKLRVYAYAIERLQKQLLEIESQPTSSYRDKQARQLRTEIRKNERALMNVQLKNLKGDLKLEQRFRKEDEYRHKIETLKEAIRNYYYLYVNGLKSTEDLKKIDPILITDVYDKLEAIRKLERLILRLTRNDKEANEYHEPIRKRLNEIKDKEDVLHPQVLPLAQPEFDPNAEWIKMFQDAVEKRDKLSTKAEL